MKTYYQKRKEELREEAIEWQASLSAWCPSYGELAYCYEYFEKLGRRYGLLREFRENGIC